MLVLAALSCLTACSPEQPDESRSCSEISAEFKPLLDVSGARIRQARSVSDAWTGARLWIERALVSHDHWVALGHCELRSGRVDAAERSFIVAQNRVRHSSDALVGRGHVGLRRGEPGEALARFLAAFRLEPQARDVREGLQLALARLPVGHPAVQPAFEALQDQSRLRPADTGILHLLTMADRRNGGSGALRLREPEANTGAPGHFARAGEDYLELRGTDGRWQPLFVIGVNVGPARPGKFASEAPADEATWRRWFDMITGLGANALRVYTLQPPGFYRALAAHNAAADAGRLWLLQGVWADLPADDDFDDPDYLDEFHEEIARVVDAIHGNLVLDPVRGTAGGVFDTDVSAHTLAWIVGREWEPFAVAAYEARNPGDCRHDGRYVRVERGRAMECWIGSTLDFTAAHEAGRYGQARPLTFANWPTLDPLHHPTEATREEEDLLRAQLSGVPLPQRTAPAWDDDGVTVDATRLVATGDFAPGVFASYHIYPNFPYFMNLEPSYAEARDEQGVLRYAGYLAALKAHHGKQPVLVAEFGMSTSRGIAHLQPEGLHHGGHDEAEAMRQNARLARAIHAARMAGGVAFAFMDEWFKSTWSTSPFEIPEDHRPRWFNAESPEQSYGLFAMRPQAPIRLDGDGSDWSGLPVLASDTTTTAGWAGLRSLRAAYDAGYVYLLLQTAGSGAPDWTTFALSVGFDTYDPARGERQLPSPADCETPTGIEFALRIAGPGDSELLVTPPYLPRHPAESGDVGALRSPRVPTGTFVPLSLETNRERFTRAGERIPAQRTLPGRLRFGSLDPAAADFDTRSDLAVGPGGAVEIRIPWALLNFADPSSGLVLDSGGGQGLATASTPGIRLYACARDLDGQSGPTSLPTPASPAATLALASWLEPRYVMEPKHGLDLFRDALRELAAAPLPPDPDTAGPSP